MNREMNPTQKAILMIAKDVTKICDENNIRYFFIHYIKIKITYNHKIFKKT